MLKNFVIKEIEDLKFYENRKYLAKTINYLHNVVIEDNENFTWKLKADIRDNTTDGKQLLYNTVYRIKGMVIVEDVNTGKIHKGKFAIPNAVVEMHGNTFISLFLLKLGELSPYVMEFEDNTDSTEVMFNEKDDNIITQVKGFNTGLLNKGTLIKVIQHIRMGITPDLNGYYIVNKTNADKLFCIKKDDLKEYEFDIKDFTYTYPSGITELSLEIIELN